MTEIENGRNRRKRERLNLSLPISVECRVSEEANWEAAAARRADAVAGELVAMVLYEALATAVRSMLRERGESAAASRRGRLC